MCGCALDALGCIVGSGIIRILCNLIASVKRKDAPTQHPFSNTHLQKYFLQAQKGLLTDHCLRIRHISKPAGSILIYPSSRFLLPQNFPLGEANFWTLPLPRYIDYLTVQQPTTPNLRPNSDSVRGLLEFASQPFLFSSRLILLCLSLPLVGAAPRIRILL